MANISALEKATLRRVSFRLLPFLMLAYLVCYIDRVNARSAALQMNKDIGLSGAIFGLGGGIFFIGYFRFEVPSNLALEKFGPRTWTCRIMITWGIVSAGMAAIPLGLSNIYDASHSYPMAMLPIAAFACVGTIVLLMLGQAKRIIVLGGT